VKAGEIWLAQIAHLRTVIVAPVTTGSRPAAFRVALTFHGKQGLIVLDQIRTLVRARLVKRLGALRPADVADAANLAGDVCAAQLSGTKASPPTATPRQGPPTWPAPAVRAVPLHADRCRSAAGLNWHHGSSFHPRPAA
jgi:hypothetical protein